MVFTAYTFLNWFYLLMIIYFVAFLAWNLFHFDDWKEQLMSTLVLIPFVLRILHIK